MAAPPATTASPSSPGGTAKSADDELLQLSEQLDASDSQTQIEQAEACIRQRDFECSQAALRNASKVATTADLKRDLAAAQAAQALEQALQQQEIVDAARARREAKRQREREEREEADADRERQWQQQRAEADASPSYTPSPAAPSTLDMLNQMNKTMMDSQRQIAAAQQQRVEQQRQANERAQRLRDDQARRDATARANQADRERQALADKRAERIAADNAERDRRQAEQLRRDDEAARRLQLAQAEQDRQVAARDARDRAAAQVASALQDQQVLKSEMEFLRQGIRLVATTCPGGEGHYYATGTRPRTDKCIDVHFTATCPGSAIESHGIARNFVGMSGCFGDTYQIEPKPACDAKQVSVHVTSVTPGCK